jgi:hypothetical protein
MGLKVERLDDPLTFPLTWNDIRETPGGTDRPAFWVALDAIYGLTTYDRSNRRFRASGRTVRLALSNEG